MINKDINLITGYDLQNLIDNSVLEGKTLEYKQSLPNDTPLEKIEFLADVSSFANASGGDLIYGIIEDRDTGEPKTLEGLDIENIDQEILRLDNIIRDGIDLRIPSVNIKSISLSSGKTALIIRVLKSWISPHRVKYKGHDKFYSRSTTGKYPLDVSELRVAFNLTETITERIRRFREDRISKIIAKETSVPLYDNPKIVLHIIPLISLNPAQSYEINKIGADVMRPISASGYDYRYNLDGLITYCCEYSGKNCLSYVQLFKNGIIEAVDAYLLAPRNKEKLIFRTYEREIFQSLYNYINVIKILEVEPPAFIFLTIVDVRGYRMFIDEMSDFLYRGMTHTIDRDILILPEVVMERYEVKAEEVLKPCFDSIWNACGYPKSLNYNNKGEWVGK